jgi:hypothetical protein
LQLKDGVGYSVCVEKITIQAMTETRCLGWNLTSLHRWGRSCCVDCWFSDEGVVEGVMIPQVIFTSNVQKDAVLVDDVLRSQPISTMKTVSNQ